MSTNIWSVDLRFDEKENLKVESRIAAIHEKEVCSRRTFSTSWTKSRWASALLPTLNTKVGRETHRSEPVSSKNLMAAMESHSGQELFSYLAEKFSNVVALDNSEHMLENAKKASEINNRSAQR